MTVGSRPHLHRQTEPFRPRGGIDPVTAASGEAGYRQDYRLRLLGVTPCTCSKAVPTRAELVEEQ
jgi:hypothetical protein